MKKAIAILVLGLLLSSNAYADSINNYLRVGMTKTELYKLVSPFWPTFKYYKTAEMGKHIILLMVNWLK